MGRHPFGDCRFRGDRAPRWRRYTWRGKGWAGVTLVQVLEPLQVQGDADCEVQLLLEFPHRHVAAAFCHLEHLPGLLQQHPHDKGFWGGVWGQVKNQAPGLLGPDAARARGVARGLRGEGPQARQARPPSAPPVGCRVGAQGIPRRRPCPRSAAARRARCRPPHGPRPHGPPPGPPPHSPPPGHPRHRGPTHDPAPGRDPRTAPGLQMARGAEGDGGGVIELPPSRRPGPQALLAASKLLSRSLTVTWPW